MTSPTPTTPRRTRLSAEDRRASILAAAIGVFAERGYQRGKVSEVAARVGVTEPVVFQNFGSKAALFAAVVDLTATRICAELADAVATGTPVAALVAEVLSPAHLDQLHAQGSLGVLFADSVAPAAEPAVAQAGQAAVRRIADALADALRHGQVTGDIRADADPGAAAWLLVSLISARPLRLAAMPEDARNRLDAAIAAMAAGLLIPAAAQPSAAQPSAQHPLA
ncbi:AcrR family transcriptional regulator [Kitasatospora sp. MAP12-15]|uniref:TetR/AcrR family transcriptional regulator n=1 Tax=unclassified Kitasatospora TaxID=2633591 RepID=UPI002472F26B|nr:helix-turn-helix domain-containing protein [Kitasatospora sp. MAP12-44]MDH6114616.1 AcrR family transcriptional regulator [Kitasatospora sp. MAP12-44]